jgi:putative phosphoribosyl transferase
MPDIHIPWLGLDLVGTLERPEEASGVVLFAHGTGSSRHSPRNRAVAEVLQRAGFATVLMDLLTEHEEELERETRHLRFDIELLAERLGAATEWIGRQPELGYLPLGYFGASTGAAAALLAASRRPHQVSAVVSRGGRPDLVGIELSRVRAPTLLIVGEADPVVMSLNREALGLIEAPSVLEVVPRATHLFEEPGALEQVASLARAWFTAHLKGDVRSQWAFR